MFHKFTLGEAGERGERGFPGRGVKGLPGPRGLPGKYKRVGIKKKTKIFVVKIYSERIPQTALKI